MIDNFKSYFKLLRIKDWRAYVLIALFGFLASEGFLSPIKEIIIFWFIILFFLAFGFSINDCFDTKEDDLDKNKEKLVISREITFKNGLAFSVFFAVSGLLLTLKFGQKALFFTLITVLLTLFYSAPPFRFKSKPFLDLISHGFFAGALIFFLPFLIFNKSPVFFHYLIAFAVFWISITLEIRNHLEDYKNDKEAGLKTTVCYLGKEKSEKILKLMIIFSPLIYLVAFFFFSPIYLLIFLVVTLIFLPKIFLFQPKRDESLSLKEYKTLKDLRIIDIYTVLSFGLIAIAQFSI